jgi:Cys-tRNA(Pro)/Cys-tRNA(Cys) deacylase
MDRHATERDGSLAVCPKVEQAIPVTKTNACRLLDKMKISYELREYDVDLEDLSALAVAHKIGLPVAQVWKTLAVRGDRLGVSMAVIAGDRELDLKGLARLSGDKKLELLSLKEVQPVTGYVRGGVTALAAKKDFPVYVDEGVRAFSIVSVSAGQRGLQILLHPEDLVRATHATTGPIMHAAHA